MILDFTVWHLTQIISVSLQLSMKNGMQQAHPPLKKSRTRHHTIVTHPTVFLGMFPVSFAQVGQGEPSPDPPLFARLMIIGSCCA